jgi:hypothetical protein
VPNTVSCITSGLRARTRYWLMGIFGALRLMATGMPGARQPLLWWRIVSAAGALQK